MTQLYFTLITLAVVISTVFFILVLIELRAAIQSIKKFIDVTENTLKPTLEEIQAYLKVAREVTENANIVTEDIKAVSGSAREISENMRSVSRGVSFLSNLINEQGSIAAIKISALRAGVKAASQIVLGSLFGKRDR
jgi:uncharacterized protein YoxC